MYKKLKYKLDGADVVRTDMIYHKTKKLYIPFDPDNIDYQEYLEWSAIEGNVPEEAD
tara:strand:+ start:1054 stop:1224 length:171 start_codon:yes stop_codon:yes gene_type:complete